MSKSASIIYHSLLNIDFMSFREAVAISNIPGPETNPAFHITNTKTSHTCQGVVIAGRNMSPQRLGLFPFWPTDSPRKTSPKSTPCAFQVFQRVETYLQLPSQVHIIRRRNGNLQSCVSQQWYRWSVRLGVCLWMWAIPSMCTPAAEQETRLAYLSEGP